MVAAPGHLPDLWLTALFGTGAVVSPLTHSICQAGSARASTSFELAHTYEWQPFGAPMLVARSSGVRLNCLQFTGANWLPFQECH
jgi:hypothetical protein